MCTGRQRDVEPIVDKHPRSRTLHGGDHPLHERHEGPGLKILLAHVHQVNASPGSLGHYLHEAILTAAAGAVGHQAEDRPH